MRYLSYVLSGVGLVASYVALFGENWMALGVFLGSFFIVATMKPLQAVEKVDLGPTEKRLKELEAKMDKIQLKMGLGR